MKILLPKLSRTEWVLLCLLVTGSALYYLSQEWTLREGARMSTGATFSFSRLDLVENVRILGAAILFPSYLILLITAERHRNASFILKCLLIVPSLSFAFMWLRTSGSPWLHLRLVFLALFLLPNRVLIRKRLFVFLYSCLVNGLVAAIVVLTLYNTSQFSYGELVAEFVLEMVNMYLILASACTLSSWLAYQRSVGYDGPGFGVTVYRWTFITLITVVSGFFAITATSTFVERGERFKFLEKSGLDPAELMNQARHYTDDNLRNQTGIANRAQADTLHERGKLADRRRTVIECTENEFFEVPFEELEGEADAKLKELAEAAGGSTEVLMQRLSTTTVTSGAYFVELTFALLGQYAIERNKEIRGYSLEGTRETVGKNWLQAVFQRVEDGGESINALVRDDGFDSFSQIRELARENGIEIQFQVLSTNDPIKLGVGGVLFGQ